MMPRLRVSWQAAAAMAADSYDQDNGGACPSAVGTVGGDGGDGVDGFWHRCIIT
jgi:hypothetical protein